jgi:hypothetical protein
MFSDRIRRSFMALRSVSRPMPMGEMPFASGGTMSSSRCRCRYVQPERVRLPDRVTVNSDGGTEGDGQYTSVGYPAGLLRSSARLPPGWASSRQPQVMAGSWRDDIRTK